jgi:hypothetical protein
MVGFFNYIHDFKISFEDKCIRLFAEAYNQSIKNKSIQLDFMENDITEILRTNIINNPQKNRWRIHVDREAIISDTNITATKGFANKLKRVDLIMETYTSSISHICSIEAKNLKENDSALKRRYIDTGIINFVTKKYPYGFLVGYLLEGTVKPTIDGINKLLESEGKEKEMLHKKNHKIVQYYYESNHSELCLKHLIFDFTML